MKRFIIIILIIFGALSIWYFSKDNGPDSEVLDSMNQNTQSDDPMTITNKDAEESQDLQNVSFDYVGNLDDVTGGNSTGVAKARVDGNIYQMLATFEDLPELEEGFFYEGWIVRKSPFNFISTGELEIVDGKYVNLYESSNTSLVDHNMYVLTLEPDDGDPAPADHILEGVMKKQ